MEVPYTAVCWMCNGVGLWPPIEREPVTVADECPVCHGYRTVTLLGEVGTADAQLDMFGVPARGPGGL